MGGAVVIALIIIGYGMLREGGVGWMNEPALWAIIAAAALVTYLSFRREPELLAGADWVRAAEWVDLYRLTMVKFVVSGATHKLVVQDERGRRARAFVMRFQNNQALWDLVYNGILHSVYSHSVETNRNARNKLLLPPWVVDGDDAARRFNEEQRRERRRWVRRERRKADRVNKFLARWVGLALCVPAAVLFPFFLYFSFEEPLKGLVLVPLLAVVCWLGRALRRFGAVRVLG